MRSPTLLDLPAAAALLDGIAVRTRLLEVPALSRVAGVPVLLKCEHEQPIGAFKQRGAFVAIARLDAGMRARGVVTSSSGNHGQGVAWAARHFGVRAVVVMPESAPVPKVDGVRRLGGEVVFAGARRGPEQLARAERYVAEDGLVMIHPYDHHDVIAGQATAAREVLADRPDADMLCVPVGGGGLLAGVCAAVAEHEGRGGARVRVVAAEPDTIPKLTAALHAGRPVSVAAGASLADGLLTTSVGERNLALIRPVLTRVVPVSDASVTRALRVIFEATGMVAEPSGAVATAALLDGRLDPRGPVVLFVTGGNVDPGVFHRLVAP